MGKMCKYFYVDSMFLQSKGTSNVIYVMKIRYTSLSAFRMKWIPHYSSRKVLFYVNMYTLSTYLACYNTLGYLSPTIWPWSQEMHIRLETADFKHQWIFCNKTDKCVALGKNIRSSICIWCYLVQYIWNRIKFNCFCTRFHIVIGCPRLSMTRLRNT